jgi:hypothetical protein
VSYNERECEKRCSKKRQQKNESSGKDSEKSSRNSVNRMKGVIMNKERLEWVMSGLIQYALTEAEDHFLKTALEDFSKNQALTGKQEARLEILYEHKSKMTPDKDCFVVKESQKEDKPRRPRWPTVY